MSYRIAIVGSGPAGFYTAEAIFKDNPEHRIDIFDRLPTPYGLVRTGVAPDHQTTKRAIRIFERTAKREQVRFLGNVELGRDLSLDEMLEGYDALILAVGSPRDRKLGIEGESLPGVYGSCEFTTWYNAHPDHGRADIHLGSRIAVIGNGNVAIDAARIPLLSEREMLETDIPQHAIDCMLAAKVEEVRIFGRRGPAQGAFTAAELRELGHMENAQPIVDVSQIPDGVDVDDPREKKAREKNLTILRGYAEQEHDPKRRPAHFHFFASPVAVLGTDKVEGIRVERTRLEGGRAKGTGEFEEYAVDSVITCIGYQVVPLEGVEANPWGTAFENEEGRIRERLWATGWARRGPSGVIGTNRKDGVEVAQKALEELRSLPETQREGVDTLLASRGIKVVTFEDWERIDEAEQAQAREGAPREKFVTYEALLQAAGK